MADYVVGSRIKDLIKSRDMHTAGSLLDAIDAEVAQMVRKAVKRAKENGRKTVRDCDL